MKGYSIYAMYQGYDHDLDEQLEKAARVESTGSGYGLFNNQRDVSFYADRKSTAINTVKRLRAAFKKAKRRGRVVVYPVNGDGETVRLY